MALQATAHVKAAWEANLYLANKKKIGFPGCSKAQPLARDNQAAAYKITYQLAARQIYLIPVPWWPKAGCFIF